MGKASPSVIYLILRLPECEGAKLWFFFLQPF
jgi:hypothetical protein